MTEKKTVFIIGAGASKEAGLPTGEELKQKISGLLDFAPREPTGQFRGNAMIFQSVLRHVETIHGNTYNHIVQPYRDAADHICNNLVLSPSIDNFIDQNRGNEALAFLAKAAIVRSILSEERSSKLYFDEQRYGVARGFNALTDTWYIPFFYTLTQNCQFEDLPKKLRALTLVVFNYDRCVENFLHHALKALYRRTDHEVAEVMENITIFVTTRPHRRSAAQTSPSESLPEDCNLCSP